MGERPFIDLGENQSLSHSRRSTFRRCRRLYFLQYVTKLQLKQTPAPLRMGSIYSDGLETESSNTVSEQYGELVAQAMHDSNYYFADQLLDELAVVKPMVETYLETVSLPDITREVAFAGPAINGYQDNGFFDGIGEQLGPNQNLLLVENKLKGRFGKAEEESLKTDEQLLGYILNATLMYGVDADRVDVRYEVAKKPGLRQGKAESRDTFRLRVTNDILNNPSKYHVIIAGDELKRNQDQLDQWVNEFDRMTQDLHREYEMAANSATEKFAWPMNRDACHQYGVCPMINICGASSSDKVQLEIQKNFNIRE